MKFIFEEGKWNVVCKDSESDGIVILLLISVLDVNKMRWGGSGWFNV